jgi:two-component system, NtrC family, response regulator HydG
VKIRVLVVDDDNAMRYTLRGILEDIGMEVDEAPHGVAALERMRHEGYHLLISDLRMPHMDGLELLRHMTGPLPKFILITAHGSERHAVEAMKAGAYDYFHKPFEVDELVAVIQRAADSVRLELENERLAGELNLSRSLLFESKAMGRLALLIQRVAPRDVTVLIHGESGTGKERIAEALVRASARAGKPFVRFNCAALTPELAESELFGHAKGAFTGAHRSRAGLFREADGGTLLLDEIGEMDPSTQAKLLRVLQEGELRPVGEDRSVPVNVRILCATHRDLAQLVTQGRFREDLYYRLKVVQLEVPPLRERPEDIPLLARHFLQRTSQRLGLPSPEPSTALLARLQAYPWPGNVRQLENALESLLVLSPPERLDLDMLPIGGAPGAEPSAAPKSLKLMTEAFERTQIEQALRGAGGNRTQAARHLSISRASLHEKLRKYGLVSREELEPDEALEGEGSSS